MMVNVIVIALNAPDCLEIQERINWAWLGCQLQGSADGMSGALALLAGQGPELVLCCCSVARQREASARLAEATPQAMLLWLTKEEYRAEPGRCVEGLIERVKAAVARLAGRQETWPDAAFTPKQAETTARSLNELAEAQDYDGLENAVTICVNRIFSQSGGNRQFIYVKIMELIVLAGYRPGQVDSCFDRLLRSDFSRKLQQMLAQESIEGVDRFLYRSICNSISLSVQGRASQVSFSVFENAIGYIADNYSQKLTLDEVARQAFMSPSYFSNCFHQRMGVTFSEYVSLIRMEKAKELLREPGMKIYEVAEKSGYEDFRHFGKMFKKYVGCSPAEYRKARQGGGTAETR